MALTYKESVMSSSTDGDSTPASVYVCGIKLVGGASGATFKLKDGSSTGSVLYESTVGNSAEKFEQVEFRAKNGLYVNITAGGGTIYIYTETD